MSTRVLRPLKDQVRKLAEHPAEIGELAKASLTLIEFVHHQSVRLYELEEALRSANKKRSPSAAPEHL